MTARNQLVCLLNDSLGHGDESISSALDGVGDGEAAWQHPAYAGEERWPGMPPPGSVLWHVAHLAHSARHYAAILRDRPADREPATPPPSGSDVHDLLEELREAHAELVRLVDGLSEAALAEPCARGMTVAEFLRMVIRHNVWHAGQIRVARRLWRFRESEDS